MNEDDLRGRAFGSYEVLRELGRGGMGIVYKAHEQTLQRMVALKVLPRHLAADPDFVARFVREARAAAQLSHPNVVHVYAVGNEDGTYYIAMEYVKGQDLKQYIRKRGQLRVEEALIITRQIAEALREAHFHGIVHRDIKPHNVLIEQTGRAKVLDFGIARLPHSGEESAGSGQNLGTPVYMAPEHLRKHEADARSDIYALGVTLYEMLSGEPPFEADSPLSMMYQVSETPFPDVTKKNPSVPDSVRRLIGKMTERRPEDRIQTANAVCEAIRELDCLSSAAAAQAPVTERKALRWLWLVPSVCIALLLGAALLLRPQEQANPVTTPEPAAPAGTSAPQTGGPPTHGAQFVVPDAYPNIQAALDAATVGETVLVKSGIYDEQLLLREGVQLHAEKSGEVIVRAEAARGTVLACVGCKNCTVANITFEHRSALPSDGCQPIVRVTNSEIAFSGCAFKHGETGVQVSGSSKTTFQKCAVQGNSRVGIEVLGERVEATVKDGRFSGNGVGVWFQGGGTGAIVDNICSSNLVSGIQVGGKTSNPDVRGNQCEDNGKYGVVLFQGTRANAWENVCCGNGRVGILVTGTGTAPTLSRNRCQGNKKYGIVFESGACGAAQENQVIGNLDCGIDVVGKNTAPTLTSNTCDQNGGSGIHLKEGAGGISRGNTCNSNKFHGILVHASSAVAERNTCNGNNEAGIGLFSGSRGTLKDNRCGGNRCGGIWVTGGSSGEIGGNVCSRNGMYGIHVSRDSSPSLGPNECSGNQQMDYHKEGSTTYNM